MQNLEFHIHCWTVNAEGLIQKRDNLNEALKHGNNGYYALCQSSGEIFYRDCGNLWAVDFGVRGLLTNILSPSPPSIDEDIVREFEEEYCFADWKIIPTTKKVFDDYKERRKTDGIPSYTIEGFNISVNRGH